MKVTIEIIGWMSVVMMLSAYLLLNAQKVSAKSRLYQWLNVLSGAGFVINSGSNGAYPSAAMNVVWMFIGIFGLLHVASSKAPAGG